MMWKALSADIASGFFSAWSFDLRKEWFIWKMISLSSEVYKKWLRHIKLKIAFLFKTKFLQWYDIVIFSWDSISWVRNCHPDSLKVYYCHTPPRYIYDLHDLYKNKLWCFQRIFFIIWCKIFQFFYERDIKKMDLILTNSKNTQWRIKKYLWIESVVLYPPVDTWKFQYIDDKNYFLSFARLAQAKRVDSIVEAFKCKTEEKLIVIYWKNDPQKNQILNLARWYNNIVCVSLEDNNELYDYIWNARATIYIPMEEDFGMSSIESMSAWKPVLGVNEWGLKETIIHTKTWYLLERDFKIQDIISAIWYFTSQRCKKMKKHCEIQANNFALKNFNSLIKEIIMKAYNNKKHI